MGDHSGSARFRVLFGPALRAYEKKTGITLAEHPLAVQLHTCHSIESITSVLLGEAQAFGEFGGSDRVIKSIKNTVLILSTLFATASLDDAMGLVRQKVLMACSTALTVFLQSFPPGKAIYAGLAILLAVCTSF
jgi:hypothetical protein